MAHKARTVAKRLALQRTCILALAVAALLAREPQRGARSGGAPARPGIVFVPPKGHSQGSEASLPRQSDAERGPGRAGTVGRAAQAQAGGFQGIDSSYNPRWLSIEEQPVGNLAWAHEQTGFAAAATAFYLFDILRILSLVPPTAVEVVAIGMIYFGLYGSRYQEIPNMDPHYQVSFYASCGWTFYAWASLVHAMACSPDPLIPLAWAEPLHTVACGVYLVSCLYFYTYHWGRQLRHLYEDRFRPWFAAGLASLTAVHALTVGHILKMLEDPGWFGTVAKIFPDQWQWIADTRLLELYVTAAALFLVILHLRGVLTGTKNAAVVFLGTVILPTAALMLETFALKAVAWQHYFMVGPKHF